MLRKACFMALTAAILLIAVSNLQAQGPVRPAEHETYAQELWDYLHGPDSNFDEWQQLAAPLELGVGPQTASAQSTKVNSVAAAALQKSGKASDLPHGSVVVMTFVESGKPSLVAAYYRLKSLKSQPKKPNWYWVTYAPDGTVVQTSADREPYARRGFFTRVDDEGRLWVLDASSSAAVDFAKHGKPAQHVTQIDGSSRKTIKSDSNQTIALFQAWKEGFSVHSDEDGRLWVFRQNSPELAEFLASGTPEKHVTHLQSGTTLKGPDRETIICYVGSVPGFVLLPGEEGRFWVFRAGSPELAEFQKSGPSEKHVTRLGTEPLHVTLKAIDSETLDAYQAALQTAL